jgi:hypothetical protein
MKQFRIQFSASFGEKCNDSGQGSVAAVVKTVMIQVFSGGCGENCNDLGQGSVVDAVKTNDSGQGSVLAVVKNVIIQDRAKWLL